MEKQTLSKSDIKRVCDILRMDDGVGANNYVEQLSWLLFLKVFENIERELKEVAALKKHDYGYFWGTHLKGKIRIRNSSKFGSYNHIRRPLY